MSHRELHMKSKAMKGISRIDSRNTHGWYVRIYGNGGVYTSKLFSDRQYGNKQKALESARIFRDHEQMVADLNKKDMRKLGQLPFYQKAPKNNASGIVGVHEVNTVTNGRKIRYFQATWTEDKKPRSKKFYVTQTRTADDARLMAIEYRKNKEAELREKWNAEQMEK